MTCKLVDWVHRGPSKLKAVLFQVAARPIISILSPGDGFRATTVLGFVPSGTSRVLHTLG